MKDFCSLYSIPVLNKHFLLSINLLSSSIDSLLISCKNFCAESGNFPRRYSGKLRP